MGHPYRIGEVTTKLGLSADTLRYYERIGLLPRVGRNGAGVRLYDDKDLSRLRFIQRARKMNFTLAEIGALLGMREAPQRARKSVRALTEKKLASVESQLTELDDLHDELRLLLNLCAARKGACPIIETMEQPRRTRRTHR